MKLSKLLPFTIFSLSTSVLAHEKPVLTIYTYDSFASKYGPAKTLEAQFEQECNCDIKFMPFQDGVTMFNRIRLEGNKTKADVMLGIDQNVMNEAEKSGLFREHHLQNNAKNLPLEWKSTIFLPYDYGEYAFIYNKQKLANPPQSLKELVERQDLKVIYQDPRTSTVGRGLLYWINQVYGEKSAQAWQTLAKHTVTVGKGWSETYGAFLKGESDLVLSYTTSPLYHQWHEQNDDYAAAPFSEGHLLQIEVAAILANSQQRSLAQQFLAFLQSPAAQKAIAYNNVMKPVNAVQADPAFKQLPNYPILNFKQPNSETTKNWLATWQQAVSK